MAQIQRIGPPDLNDQLLFLWADPPDCTDASVGIGPLERPNKVDRDNDGLGEIERKKSPDFARTDAGNQAWNCHCVARGAV